MLNNAMLKHAAGLLLAVWAQGVYALDSYRYLHVTIETPWRIFLFLLVGILVPFIVLAWLYWRHAYRGRKTERRDGG